jgi:hypothetical protein
MADPKPPREGVDSIVSRIRENEKQTRLLSGASGTQRNMVLADLAGRLSYFLTDRDFYQVWERTDGGDTPTFLTDIPIGPVLTFGLRERRLVRIVTTSSIDVSFTSYDANRSGSAGITSTAIVDGAFGIFADETDAAWADIPLGPPMIRLDGASKRARVEQYLDLAPGEHTVQVALANVQVTPSGTGTAWNARITAASPAIAVDVLQPLA